MDMLKKGIFTVITATVITSVLILFTSNANKKIVNLHDDTSREALSHSTKLSVIPSEQRLVSLLPPPGPFFKAKFADKQASSSISKLKPKAPIISLGERRPLVKTSVILQKDPVIQKFVGTQIDSSVSTIELNKPKFNRGILKEPTSPMMPEFNFKFNKEQKPEPPIQPNFTGVQANIPLSISNRFPQDQYRYVPMPMVPDFQFQNYPNFGISSYQLPKFDLNQNNEISPLGDSMKGNNK